MVLRFSESVSGRVAQVLTDADGYSLGLPPGHYEVRAGVLTALGAFARTCDLASLTVTGDLRWDVDLAAAPTAVAPSPPALPAAVVLNPFNPATNLRYQLAAPAAAELTIYDLRGQRVRRLVHGVQPAGRPAALWDGCDEQGRAAARGIFLCRLTVSRPGGNEVAARKLALIR